jgi:hypothetical protein
MMKTRTFLSLSVMAVAFSMGAYGPAVAADAMTLSAKLSGANEVPANASTGSGMLEPVWTSKLIC